MTRILYCPSVIKKSIKSSSSRVNASDILDMSISTITVNLCDLFIFCYYVIDFKLQIYSSHFQIHPF